MSSTTTTAPFEAPPKPRQTLFDIGAEGDRILQLLEENGGEITEEIDALLESNTTDLQTKLDNYAALITEVKARAEARKAESKRIAERAAIDSNFVERLRERLQFFFEEHGHTKVETPRYTVSLVGNGGKAPMPIDENLSLDDVPDNFIRVVRELDREAVREFLEAGGTLPFARIAERGKSIRIK